MKTVSTILFATLIAAASVGCASSQQQSSVMDDGYSTVVSDMLKPATAPLPLASDDGTFIGVQQLIAEKNGTVLPADPYLMDDGYADVIIDMLKTASRK